jgi:citrate lyase subunit beta / citryl-CoA lyase
MRSLLFIPGDDERKLAKGVGSGADALILDLEDAVSGARKPAARAISAQYIAATRATLTRPLLYVRINGLDTPYWQDDLADVMGSQPDGILLPKSRSGEDVHTLSIALDHAEQRTGAGKGVTRIMALVTETAISLLRLNTYVGASSRLQGLTWGAEDLAAAVGARSNRETDGRTWTSPYLLARNLCLFTAVAAHAQPIDTVFVNYRDEEGLRAEANAAARDGFSGKMAIHPGQVAAINDAFTPTAAEVADGEELVALFAANPSVGALVFRGQMVDRAHEVRAQRILQRAKDLQRG